MSRGVARRAAVWSVVVAVLGLASAPQAQAAARQVRAEGSFVAAVDFASLVPAAVGAAKCRFRVEGALTFSGTLSGTADGVTTALIDAPCEAALANPPGTFADVFRFEGTFTGTTAGVPVVDGELSYAGVTRVGGAIEANLKLRDENAQATLRTTDAALGVGGDYRGVAVLR